MIASEVFYVCTLMVSKLSIGRFFVRIALRTWHRYVVIAAMVTSTLFSFVMVMFVIFQCGTFTGISQFVANSVAGKCLSKSILVGMIYAHAGVTAATDWTFVLMPILIVRSIAMTKFQKVAVAGLLCLASGGAMASIVRFIYIPAMAEPTTIYFTKAKLISIWSGLETGVGIMAASVICLRPLFRHHLGLFRGPGFQETTELEDRTMVVPESPGSSTRRLYMYEGRLSS